MPCKIAHSSLPGIQLHCPDVAFSDCLLGKKPLTKLLREKVWCVYYQNTSNNNDCRNNKNSNNKINIEKKELHLTYKRASIKTKDILYDVKTSK